jgi:hypothetical protein
MYNCLGFLTWFVLAAPSFGALYTHPSQLPTFTYDYIVVGGVYLANDFGSMQTVS